MCALPLTPVAVFVDCLSVVSDYGGTLRVALVRYGEENHAALFELARQQALRYLVCVDGRHASSINHEVKSIVAMAPLHRVAQALAGMVSP